VNIALKQGLVPDIKPLLAAVTCFPQRHLDSQEFLALIDKIKDAIDQTERGADFIKAVPDSHFTAEQLLVRRKIEAAITAHLEDCRALLSRAEQLRTGWFRESWSPSAQVPDL
jgi:hypothetical protein